MSYLISQYSSTPKISPDTKHHSLKKAYTQTQTDRPQYVLTLASSIPIGLTDTDNDLNVSDGNVHLTFSQESLKLYANYLKNSPPLAVITKEDELLMEAIRKTRGLKKVL